jgi:hypothetical protein
LSQKSTLDKLPIPAILVPLQNTYLEKGGEQMNKITVQVIVVGVDFVRHSLDGRRV